jgi:hypothetical protein
LAPVSATEASTSLCCPSWMAISLRVSSFMPTRFSWCPSCERPLA